MIKIKPLHRATKIIRIIKPKISSIHVIELNDCLVQLDDILHSADKTILLKISVFIKSEDIIQFNEFQSSITELLGEHFGSALPIVCFIAEPPAENYNLVFEATFFDNSESNFHIDFYHNPKSSYCVIANHDFEEIFGVTMDIKPNDQGIYAQSSNCFDEIEHILEENGLTLADIHRQWTYIGKINDFSRLNDKEVEHYQLFNIARAHYYSKHEWKNGFPAATGIGANIPGCTIEFTASPVNDNTIIIPLHNPKQQDAHRYSEKYQISEIQAATSDNYANTPKFERGKIVITNNMMDVYISGTAAIIGEDSIKRSVSEQTEITLGNISELYSKGNLHAHGLDIEGGLPKFALLRVYIKNSGDCAIALEICRKYYPDVPVLIVEADVCRKELLVEIEAYANTTIERM